MNGESFYDSFHDWHPPSPRSTPQSAKFGFYPLQSPIVTGTSPLPPQHGWVASQPQSNTSMRMEHGYPGQDAVGMPSNSLSSKRQRPQSDSHSPVSAGQQQHSVQQVSTNYHQASFPSGSFVDRFDSTSLEDPFTAPSAAPASTPRTQMRTPPPTRDDSARRKPQQPRLAEFQTPSTIISRRMSVPNESWHSHPSDAPFQDPSPFTFTPLQFSSSPSQFGFTPSGPMTAPVYPQSGLFWEPNSHHALNQMSFSTIAEEPFGINPHNSSVSFAFDPQEPSSHRFALSEGYILPSQLSQSMSRPQSARSADRRPVEYSSNPPSVSVTSSVDPTMLWNNNSSEAQTFARPAPPAAPGNSESRQPYQHQTESLRREKEERSRRASRVTSASNDGDLAPHSAERSLRRSLTDSRARRSGNFSQNRQVSLTDLADPQYGSKGSQITREGSPLKRHKTGSQQEQVTPTKPAAVRRSVVLTVDEKGRARTEVTAVADDRSSSKLAYRGSRSVDGESDSSDLPEMGSRPANAPRPNLGSPPASSDAQDALREVVRNRKMKRPDFAPGTGQRESSNISMHLADSSLPSSASKSSTNISGSHSNNSPTTITDPEFHTPTREGVFESSGATRCICNGKVPEDRANLMIECESCKYWLHVACLGISPEQIPPVFICLFCSTTPAGTRGGRPRAHSSAMYQDVGRR